MGSNALIFANAIVTLTAHDQVKRFIQFVKHVATWRDKEHVWTDAEIFLSVGSSQLDTCKKLIKVMTKHSQRFIVDVPRNMAYAVLGFSSSNTE